MAGKITALIVQKRNKNRVNVYLDGEFAFGLAAIEAIKLHKGQTLGEDEIERLRALDATEQAHERALALLAYRPRSADEIRQRLGTAGFSEQAITAAIERLTSAGLLDDLAFARYWVESRGQFSPRGARALRFELRRKGISDAAAAEALDDLDESALAYRVGRKRLERLRHLDEAARRKRLGDYLHRRGFSYEVVNDVLDRLWRDDDQEKDEHRDWEG